MAIIPHSRVVDHQLLPIDAQDVVTYSRIVVAGSQAGEVPWQKITNINTSAEDEMSVPHIWTPISYGLTGPDHVTYFAERAFAVPEGLNPFLRGPDLPGDPASFGFDNPGNPSAVRDGDPLTYATVPDLSGSAHALFYDGVNTPGRKVGFRLVYRLNLDPGPRTGHVTGTPAIVQIALIASHPDGYPSIASFFIWAVPETPDGQEREIYGLASFDARTAPVNFGAPPNLVHTVGLVLMPQVVGGDVRVIEFVPLMLDDAVLGPLVVRQMKVPAQNPRRVTVDGFVPPDRQHTITGWPGGDYTGAAAQHQYSGGRTVVDFERAGSPLGLPADMVEAAATRRAAVRSDIAIAGYPLLMGQRQ